MYNINSLLHKNLFTHFVCIQSPSRYVQHSVLLCVKKKRRPRHRNCNLGCEDILGVSKANLSGLLLVAEDISLGLSA